MICRFGMLVAAGANANVGIVVVGRPTAPGVSVGIYVKDQILLGHSIQFLVKESVTLRAFVVGLHARLGTGSVLLRNEIAVFMLDRTCICAGITSGVTGVIPYVSALALDAILGIGAIRVGACVPVVARAGLEIIIVGVGVIDGANRNRGFSNGKIRTLPVARIVDGNAACYDLPMGEAPAFGGVVSDQLHVVAVRLFVNGGAL